MIALRATHIPLSSREFGRVEPGQIFHTQFPDTANALLRRGQAERYYPPPVAYIPPPKIEPQKAVTYETKVITPEEPKRGRPGKATACKCGQMCISARAARAHCRKGATQ